MTGGVVYLLDADEANVRALLQEHATETSSPTAEGLLASFDPARFLHASTCVPPERLE